MISIGDTVYALCLGQVMPGKVIAIRDKEIKRWFRKNIIKKQYLVHFKFTRSYKGFTFEECERLDWVDGSEIGG